MTQLVTPTKPDTDNLATAELPAAATENSLTPALATALVSASALALEGCGEGSSGSGGSPSPTPTPLSATQASRFLAQAAIGYSKADINSVVFSGITGWLNSQFGLARPQEFWDFLIANGYDAAANVNTNNGFDAMMWSQLKGSGDILRQRIGLSLLNIWVAGIDGFGASWEPFIMATYLDGLWDNALGNYRAIMDSVSTSVAMSLFLTFLGNLKANPTTGSISDENYARELMQLFTIGLYQLNMDGTQVLSGGNPVPAFTQDDVSQGASVWTGYALGKASNAGGVAVSGLEMSQNSERRAWKEEELRRMLKEIM